MEDLTFFLWILGPFIGGLVALIAAPRCRRTVDAFSVGFLLTVVVGVVLTAGAGLAHYSCLSVRRDIAFYLLGGGLVQAIGFPFGAVVIGTISATTVRMRNVQAGSSQ